MTLEKLITHFYDHPSYLETGGPKLAKQFNVSLDLINQAKAHVRGVLKTEIMKDLKQETISFRDFAKHMGIDMDEVLPEDYDFISSRTVHQGEVIKEDVWEEKVKWVKTKGESKLLVKKFPVEDFKKEFSNFLQSYTLPKSEEVVYQDMTSALLVYMSDKHIGAKTKENSPLENNYDAKEFEKRMTILADNIIQLDKEREFESILLIDFGDTIDGFSGFTTRGGHVLPQNMTNREVFTTFLKVHMDFIGRIQDSCKCNISYITVGESNHGGDMEWICNKSLEVACQYKYPDVTFFVGDKFIEHFTIADHCFIICHGKDMEDMKNPLPLNLDQKTELYFKKYMDTHNINSKYTHIIKGDLHQASCQYGEFFRYKNVLSMYGASKWIQTNFMNNTKGVCMDILFNDKIEEHYLFFH